MTLDDVCSQSTVYLLGVYVRTRTASKYLDELRKLVRQEPVSADEIQGGFRHIYYSPRGEALLNLHGQKFSYLNPQGERVVYMPPVEEIYRFAEQHLISLALRQEIDLRELRMSVESFGLPKPHRHKTPVLAGRPARQVATGPHYAEAGREPATLYTN